MVIGVSACLAGCKCRYDGDSNLIPCIKRMLDDNQALAICPEVMGGLSIPRVPCERMSAKVIGKDGADYTGYFEKGAQKAMEQLLENDIKSVILKERSPSCGVNQVYDGSFSGELIAGHGLMVEILKEYSLDVYSEAELARFFRNNPAYQKYNDGM